MANLALRLPENIPGDFFVDSTCIDCDACRQIAPEIFSEDGDTSIVHRHPELAWSAGRETLTAFRSACWYSWSEQTHLMEKLRDNYSEWDFEWVLPGHGRIHHDSPENMRRHLERCIEWMKTR
jgi:ferredoxin